MGKINGNAKLRDCDVIDIRSRTNARREKIAALKAEIEALKSELYEVKREDSQVQLAFEFGVSEGTISQVIYGTSWGHVK